MEAKRLPGVSIAVADGREVLWADGFGQADPARKLAAAPGSLYRVGSISKPMTAVAILRCAERGELDLDAPVTEHFPEFRPRGPSAGSITLRHLLAHRSGLPSEPPRGGYFDASAPPLAEVVRSLNDAELLFAPGARFKDSNAGYAVAGQVLAAQAGRGRGFAAVIDAEVIGPLGLEHTSFDPAAAAPTQGPAARGQMWTYDGRTFDAPTFRPVRPVRELEAEALRASPPQEQEPPANDAHAPPLVELVALDPTIKLDVRYASANNFLGEPLYRSARAFLRKPAAEALVRAHRALKARGFGLLVYNAYRPWYITKVIWDATPTDMHDFVADAARGSRHNRGAAVDLTLYDLATGEPVEMVSGYDEFSPRAYPGYRGAPRERAGTATS